MRVLANYIMRGQLPAIGVTAVAAALSFLLPPLMWISGAALALVTLRQGARQGLRVMLGALLVCALLVMPVVGSPIAALLMLPFIWLPMLMLAEVLRSTVSLARCLQAAAGLALLVMLLLHLGLGDTAAWWRGVLDRVLVSAMRDAGMQTGGAEFAEALDLLAGMMTGLVLASWLLTLVISLLLARAWQAAQVNPGGLRQEFHALRLGRSWSLVAVMLLLVALFSRWSWAIDAVTVLIVAFVLQGLAVVHAIFAQRGMPGFWLLPLYVLLVFAMPQTASLLALLGLVDNVYDVRARMATKSRVD